jgi:glycogen operon protein
VPHGGSPAALGATLTAEGVNFAVYSETASAIFVSLYDELDQEIGRCELDGHQDNVHFGLIAGIGGGAKYGFRADGPYDPAQGYHFDPQKLLVDPYARRLDRPFVRSPRLRLPREDAVDTAPLVPKGVVMGRATHRRRRAAGGPRYSMSSTCVVTPCGTPACRGRCAAPSPASARAR